MFCVQAARVLVETQPSNSGLTRVEKLHTHTFERQQLTSLGARWLAGELTSLSFNRLCGRSTASRCESLTSNYSGAILTRAGGPGGGGAVARWSGSSVVGLGIQASSAADAPPGSPLILCSLTDFRQDGARDSGIDTSVTARHVRARAPFRH